MLRAVIESTIYPLVAVTHRLMANRFRLNFAFRFSYMDELRSGKFRLLFRELQVFYRWFNAGTKGVPSFALRQNGRPILDRPGENHRRTNCFAEAYSFGGRETKPRTPFGWGEQIQIPGMTIPVSETAEVILALPRGEAVELDARKRIPRCLLELNNVCCKFGKNPGLKEITFSATGGQLVAVMGPSGCGKSTLLGTMTGKVPLSSGAITIDGVDLTKLVRENPRFLGYVPQDDSAFPNSDGGGKLALWRSLASARRRKTGNRRARSRGASGGRSCRSRARNSWGYKQQDFERRSA